MVLLWQSSHGLRRHLHDFGSIPDGTVPCRWGYWGYGDTYDKSDNESAYDAILSTSVNFWDTG